MFYFDANAAPPSVTEHGPDAEEPEAAAAESSGSDHLGDDDDDDEAPETQPISLPSRTRSKAAWTDPDDTALSISLASNTRLRKLRDASIDDVVRGHEYERRLRRQYEKINPTPEWALNARKRTKRKRRRTEEGEEGDSEDSEATHDLFTSTSGILASSGTAKHKIIQPEKLEIERLRDANQAARSEGEVKVVQFHPSPQIPVLLTAGLDRRVRLFNV